MKSSTLPLLALAAAFSLLPSPAPAQTTNDPNDPAAILPAIPEGFVAIEGKTFFVLQGRATPVDREVQARAAQHGLTHLEALGKTLQKGQMMTMDGKVVRLPDSLVFTKSPAADEEARRLDAAESRTNLDTTLAPAGKQGVPVVTRIGGGGNPSATPTNAPNGNFDNPPSTGAPTNTTGAAPGVLATDINDGGGIVGGAGIGARTATSGNGRSTTLNADGTVGVSGQAGATVNANGNGTNANGTTVRGGTPNSNTATNGGAPAGNGTSVDASGNVINSNGAAGNGSTTGSNGSAVNNGTNTNGTTTGSNGAAVNNGTTNGTNNPNNANPNTTGTPGANGAMTHADGTTTTTNANGTSSAVNSNGSGTTSATGSTTNANGTNTTTGSGTTATGSRSGVSGAGTTSGGSGGTKGGGTSGGGSTGGGGGAGGGGGRGR